MRVGKFLSAVSFVTCLCVLYVYQQTEVFRFGYMGEKRLTVYQDLLDKNTVLKYNINKNASLIRIGNQIYSGSGYEMPSNYQVVRMPYSREAKSSRRLAKKESLMARVFGIKTQAQAQDFNP